MRKITITLLASGFWLVACGFSFAQDDKEATATSKKTKQEATVAALAKDNEKKAKIEDIKEKIASTVAQLNLVSKKGFVGEITRIEKSQFIIERHGRPQSIDVDELTKYLVIDKDGTRKETRALDLDVGTRVVAIGLYNKDSERLLARVVLNKDIIVQVTGVVREVDIKDGTITVEKSKKNGQFVVDIEKTTLTRKFTRAEGIVKSGLSKIEIGQRGHVTGIRRQKEDNRISATRVLLLPGKLAAITAAPTTKEATGSSQTSTASNAAEKP